MKLNALMWIPLVVATVIFCAAAYFRGRRATRFERAYRRSLGSDWLLLDVCGYWVGLWTTWEDTSHTGRGWFTSPSLSYKAQWPCSAGI